MTLETQPQHDAEIAALGPWFHNVHLPDGRQTAPNHPLGDFPDFKWRELARSLPPDLTGWRALDIGCNAGFYSFELARRGADVLAIDCEERYLRQARWARTKLRLDEHVELRRMQVYELARWTEMFDLVLFLGVLYHLRYPLLALDIVARRTGELLALQTLTVPSEPAGIVPTDLDLDQRAELRGPRWPAMAFVEHSLAGDPTNWWVPTEACVEAMARSAGLDVIDRPGHEWFLCRRSRAGPENPGLRTIEAAFQQRPPAAASP
jgi:tRNA (mo5U34)-methyltransferase